MMYKLKSVEALQHPVLRLVYEDGVAGELDLSAELARGPAFEPLRDPGFFRAVRLAEDGLSFGWRLNQAGQEIDFSSDGARADIESNIVREMAARHRAQRTAAE